MFTYLSPIHLSLYPSTYLSSTHLPINLLIYHPPSIHHPFIFYQTIYIYISSIHPSFHLFNYLSIHWSIIHSSSYLNNKSYTFCNFSSPITIYWLLSIICVLNLHIHIYIYLSIIYDNLLIFFFVYLAIQDSSWIPDSFDHLASWSQYWSTKGVFCLFVSGENFL